MSLAQKFRQTVELVRKSQGPVTCWMELLRIAGLDNPALRTAPIVDDIASVTAQLCQIFTKHPIPPGISFWWFGLFDVEASGKEGAGFYVGGGRGDEQPEHQLAKGITFTYPPADDVLESQVLDVVQAQKTLMPDSYQILDYLLTFGAAAIIAKFAAAACGMTLPVFVGFNSGDFACVSGREELEIS